MILYSEVQYAKPEITSIVVSCYGVVLFKEEIKNTRFVNLEFKIVQD